jgi:hypothetical protein
LVKWVVFSVNSRSVVEIKDLFHIGPWLLCNSVFSPMRSANSLT